MKISRGVMLVAAMFLVLLSCKKEYSNESGKPDPVVELFWEFSAAGKDYGGPMDTALLQTTGNTKTLTLTGPTSGNTQHEIFLQVIGENISAGTYSGAAVYFQYTENGTVVYQTPALLNNSSFSITITEINEDKVTGTFSGIVQDPQGNQFEVTEGKFESAVKNTDDPTEPLPTQLTVWTRALCQDGGPVEIRVGNQVAQITAGMTAEPLCGAAGAATFELVTGDYTVEAICGTDTVRYDISVVQDCNLLEVDVEIDDTDYLPDSQGSFWEYNDLSDQSVTQRITAENQETLANEQTYTRFVSTLGDTFYYRKAQNIYYEYRTLDFQGYVEEPTTVELVILRDNYAEGESWESEGFDVELALPVKVKFRSTITQRDFTANINGVDYDDLIEVYTEILFSTDNGQTYTSGSAYVTVFGKDKGIVYYYDLDREIEWGINNYSINP